METTRGDTVPPQEMTPEQAVQAAANTAQGRHTVPPEEITPELMPTVEALGLVGHCRQLATEGWTIIEDAVDPSFVARLRRTILAGLPLNAAGGGGVEFMMLGKDPVYAEAVLHPKAMAMAEFSVGRGFLLGSLAASVRANGEPGLPLHADQDMFPAPFPDHNMMLTVCWVLDDFTQAGGATRVQPGSAQFRRHPTDAEGANPDGFAMACPAGSLVLWDGRVWHGSFDRTTDGQRVVLHATYYRLLMRPGEDYSDVADDLIATHGQPMSRLLGREDFFYKKHFDYVADYDVFVQTMNNSRS